MTSDGWQGAMRTGGLDTLAGDILTETGLADSPAVARHQSIPLRLFPQSDPYDLAAHMRDGQQIRQIFEAVVATMRSDHAQPAVDPGRRLARPRFELVYPSGATQAYAVSDAMWLVESPYGIATRNDIAREREALARSSAATETMFAQNAWLADVVTATQPQALAELARIASHLTNR